MIDIPHNKIVLFCKKWQVCELSLFDLVYMQGELKEIFGGNIDLVSRRGLESSQNYIRRDALLSSAEAVYAA